jgi:hypothetical protein
VRANPLRFKAEGLPDRSVIFRGKNLNGHEVFLDDDHVRIDVD